MTALPSFRQATINDIPAMSAIRLSVTENVLSDPSRVTHQMYVDFLEDSGMGWVAVINDAIVGFCYADKTIGSIWALFVRPGYEGQGLAKALLKRAVDFLFEHGYDRISLNTGANTRADRFYAAQGWQRTISGPTDIAYSLPRPASN